MCVHKCDLKAPLKISAWALLPLSPHSPDTGSGLSLFGCLGTYWPGPSASQLLYSFKYLLKAFFGPGTGQSWALTSENLQPHVKDKPYSKNHTIKYSASKCLFLKRYFYVDHFLKSLLNLLQYCFCFIFCFFGLQASGILVPQPGIEPAPLALEGTVLIPGPPGKSLSRCFFFLLWNWFKFTKKY